MFRSGYRVFLWFWSVASSVSAAMTIIRIFPCPAQCTTIHESRFSVAGYFGRRRELLALMMANAGGAWDNAKKYVEEGNYGGKGSENS